VTCHGQKDEAEASVVGVTNIDENLTKFNPTIKSQKSVNKKNKRCFYYFCFAQQLNSLANF